MPRSKHALTSGLAIALAVGCASTPPVDRAAAELASETGARLQAISVVDRELVWVSGLEGTWGRSEDGGRRWVFGRIDGAEELQLRDIHAFDAEVAYALSAGEGEASRIFKTVDGGRTWRQQWVMSEPQGFLDCFDFWDRDRGLAYGDSIDGKLYLLATQDGRAWKRLPPEGLPAAVEGEGGFAASGTCVVVRPPANAWIGTGAGRVPRVLRSEDGGASWEVAELPTVAGTAAGIMSVVVGGDGRIDAFGGDLEQREAHTENVARSTDGGAGWTLAAAPGFTGAIYGADRWEGSGGSALAVAGPGGVDVSWDGAETWVEVSRSEFWATAFLDAETLIAVGPEGRIATFRLVEPSS